MSDHSQNLIQLASGHDAIARGDARIAAYCEDAMLHAEPDLVIRARDAQDAQEVVAFCAAQQIPLTVCGAQTSMTGASVATSGVLLSTEKLSGVIDIRESAQPSIIVRPATITADVQRAADEAGYFFPVSPTSRDACFIGGNIATNASGEDSYRYGQLRPYVRALTIIDGLGARRRLERTAADAPPSGPSCAGYWPGARNPIDLFIGSEGTLGLIVEAELALLPQRAPDFFSGMIPFPTTRAALEFVVQIATTRPLEPRALELIDAAALAIMRTHPEPVPFLQDVQALVYFKQEYRDASERDTQLIAWHECIANSEGRAFADQILIAESPDDQERFRLWRHHIPSKLNEDARRHWANGGGKIGSDWWVPPARLLEMMDFFFAEACALGLPAMAYAHVGRGHPHTNLIARSAQEKQRAYEMLRRCAQRAVHLGGGVAGEHGLGKLHADLLAVQYSPAEIAGMRAIKRKYDPQYILGRGNIFEEAR